MAPERSPKRQKTSANSETPSRATEPTRIPVPPSSATQTPNLASSTDSAERAANRSVSEPYSRTCREVTDSQQSWYSSWSRKAPPITQVARESIKSASDKASEVASVIKDVSTVPKTVRSPSLAMTLGKGRSSRASLADATTTMVHAEAKSPARNPSKSLVTDASSIQTTQSQISKNESGQKQESKEAEDNVQPSDKETAAVDSQPELQNQRSSWLGWLARGDLNILSDQTVPALEQAQDASKKVEEHTTPPSQPEEAVSTSATQTEPTQTDQAGKRGWFSLWSAEAPETQSTGNEGAEHSANNQHLSKLGSGDTQMLVGQVGNMQISQTQPSSSVIQTLPSDQPNDANKASAWVFWSRDRKANDSSASVDKPREGEIAVSDTPSEDKPRKASISISKEKSVSQPNLSKPDPKKPEAKKAELKDTISTDKSVETTRPELSESTQVKTHKKQDSKNDLTLTKAESSNATALAAEPVENRKSASTKSTQTSKHLLLPDLHATLRLLESPSLLLRLASLFYTAKEPDMSHLSLIKDPPRIKNALAIGVHGYFPAPLIRSVLGQPTGTSIKFADMTAKSIKRWTTARGYECQVKTAALEGEGKIAERLELLWKLLLNWIEEIRNSDFIMIACHSQGVPVAIMLVAKLIQFGCVSAARVCICAMAGVNMGPFQEYKSRWIGGSAGELFDFSDPTSRVSTDYLSALDVVLKFGVRLTFVGSIDDQLVSLESSIYSPISHPHIFRAVSIDARIHAPNFLSHLVGFALKLRNLGVQDHGLIRELSSPLAGSLYTGEGHSRIYEDDKVYDLAVSFAMETSALPGISLTQRAVVAGGSNPYILPFAMRGILEEDFVKNELQTEASDLLKEFDEWKPTSKVLKDVKFRLEGIRSKL